MDPKPDKFVWPPKPLVDEPAPDLSPGAVHLLTDAVDDIEEPIEESEASAESLPPLRGWRRWLEAAEVHLLGRTVAPWSRRAANWRRDEIGDYCPRCGIACRPFELDTLSDPATCPRCRNKRPAWDRFIRVGSYEGTLARAIRELKFTRFRAVGEPLGRELGLAITEELQARRIDPQSVRLVPMAMSPRRRLARGIDHALVIARAASRASDIPLACVLARTHRPSQITLPVSERRGNVAGSFSCRRGLARHAKASLFIVVDDVRTTGATMTEACRTLRQGLPAWTTVPAKDRTDIWAAAVGVAPLAKQEERA